jgi:hypothetical protein
MSNGKDEEQAERMKDKGKVALCPFSLNLRLFPVPAHTACNGHYFLANNI